MTIKYTMLDKKSSKILLLAILFSFSLTGCSSWFGWHVRPIEQGNVIEAKQVNQLKKGMSKGQVASIMGTPVLVNTFSPSQWQYVYILQQHRNRHIFQRVTVNFKDDRLTSIDKALPLNPEAKPADKAT